MFWKRFTLFKLFGFEVRIDLSWIIIAFLVTWSLASGTFPFYLKGLSAGTYWIMGVIGALGLFASVIFHEMCHSLVARTFGLPMKGITLFIFGGVAEMSDEPPSPKAEFFMAIAGPLSSFFLGAVFLGINYLGMRAGWLPAVRLVLSYLWIINVVLGAFNLIPAFPLDGGRVLRSILWQWKKRIGWATRISASVGSVFGILLILLGIVSFVAGNFIGGIWWVLIGLFLRNAAQMSYQSIIVRRYLEGERIGRFMKTNIVTVPSGTSIRGLVEDYIYHYHYDLFPINEDHSLRCITTREVKTVPREEWGSHTVDEYAKPCSLDNTLSVDDDAMKALMKMNETGNSRFMVVDHEGNLAGVITLKDLMSFLSVKMDLDEKSRE